MLEAATGSIDHFPGLLARLPADLDLEALARETHAFRRPRGARSGTDLLRLSLAWGCGGCSLKHVVAWADERSMASLSDAALSQRLHGAVDFFAAVCAGLLQRVGSAPGWRGRVFRACDSSSLSKPASQGTDWRIHGVYDLGLGGFSHLSITDRHGGEALDRGQPMAGEIRLGDRGFANARAWRRYCALANT